MQENLSLGFLTRSDTNQNVQSQRMARSLKIQIYVVKGLYYLCSENKGTNQLNFLVTAKLIRCAFVFTYAKGRFSHDAAQIIETIHISRNKILA